MHAKIRLDHVIPARGYFSGKLQQGETLRIIDLEGRQVVDLIAFSASDKSEKLSCAYSNILNRTWKLTQGHILYSNRTNSLLAITADKVGLHYSGGGFCTAEINYARFKVSDTPNCAVNLTSAFKPYGIQRGDFNFDCCFNIFMNLTYGADGSMQLAEPLSKPGDFIDLRAEMDSIVALSNCPQDRNPCNAFKPTSMRVQVFSR